MAFTSRSCLFLLALLLSACQSGNQQPPAPAAPPPAAASRPSPTPARAPASAAASGPSFDCAKASSRYEKMVCDTPELSALDRQLDGVFKQALARSTEKDVLRAEQRGWIKGRDECWKASDVMACVRELYQVRIVELRVDRGLAPQARTVAYDCRGSDQPLTAAFYNDAPRAAIVTLGRDRAILIGAPSASGVRYQYGGQAELREHQGETQVNFFGIQLSCKPKA